MGYASIINLRLATEPGADIERHTAVAKSVGIPYHHIPFSVTAPDPAAVDTLLGLSRETLKQFFLAEIQKRKK